MSLSTGRAVAALAVASLLGGGAALGGAALLGAFDGGSTTTVVERVGVAPAAVPAVATGQLTVATIYRRSAPGVVQVNASGASGSSEPGQGSSSTRPATSSRTTT